MTIFGLIILIVVVCLVIWLAKTYLPEPFGRITIIVVVILVIIVLLSAVGLIPGLYTRIK